MKQLVLILPHEYIWNLLVFLFIYIFSSNVFFPQIKERLLQLTDKRKDMIDKWEDRWEWLRLGEMFHPVRQLVKQFLSLSFSHMK